MTRGVTLLPGPACWVGRVLRPPARPWGFQLGSSPAEDFASRLVGRQVYEAVCFANPMRTVTVRLLSTGKCRCQQSCLLPNAPHGEEAMVWEGGDRGSSERARRVTAVQDRGWDVPQGRFCLPRLSMRRSHRYTRCSYGGSHSLEHGVLGRCVRNVVRGLILPSTSPPGGCIQATPADEINCSAGVCSTASATVVPCRMLTCRCGRRVWVGSRPNSDAGCTPDHEMPCCTGGAV